MGELIIRKATEDDVLSISEMEKICFPEDPWSYDSVYEDVVKNNLAFYLVAEADGCLAGYMGIWQIVDEGHITNVAVAPEFRRKHIGEALVSVVIDVTKDAGVSSWTLEVRVDNNPAIKLYEKMGFKPAGIRKGYYQYDGTDAMIMWKQNEEQ